MTPTEKHYHAVQFYKNEESLAATVAQFLADGLNAGQPGLIIATATHAKAILRELLAKGMNPEELRRTGELQVLDAQTVLSTFMLGDRPDPGLFKDNVGGVISRLCLGRQPCPIRAYGEIVDLLWQDGNAEGAIKLEMLWNQLATTYDFSLLCGYAFGHFYKETRDPRYQQVCDLHSNLLSA